jgi:hypothetical protein
MKILEISQEVLTKHVGTVGYILVALSTMGYGVVWVIKNFPDYIKKIFISHTLDVERIHAEASKHRKLIVPKIQEELKEVVKAAKCDRALLLEFSNGTSNYVGLPFLFATATVEVTAPKVPTVSEFYQRLNVSLFSDFISVLEEKGYVDISKIEDIEDKYPILYGYLKTSKVKSAIFYTLYDGENSIGCIVATSLSRVLDRHEIMPKLAAAAQRISAFLNYNQIKNELQ